MTLATEILTEAETFGADTIVVTTGTRSSVKRALLGSVAEAVLRHARALRARLDLLHVFTAEAVVMIVKQAGKYVVVSEMTGRRFGT